MSTFACPVVIIEKLEPHPGADTLSITEIEGNAVVVKTASFNVGDRAVYFPLDSMVPLDHPAFAFLVEKSRPNKTHRRIAEGVIQFCEEQACK